MLENRMQKGVIIEQYGNDSPINVTGDVCCAYDGPCHKKLRKFANWDPEKAADLGGQVAEVAD